MDTFVPETANDSASFSEKPQLSYQEFKNLRRQYFTVRHPIVAMCGHKIDMDNDPKRNCEYCWFAYFQTHGELTQTADEIYNNMGKEFLIKLRGEKFVKMFLRFMATIAKFKQELEAKNESNRVNTGTAPETQEQIVAEDDIAEANA